MVAGPGSRLFRIARLGRLQQRAALNIPDSQCVSLRHRPPGCRRAVIAIARTPLESPSSVRKAAAFEIPHLDRLTLADTAHATVGCDRDGSNVAFGDRGSDTVRSTAPSSRRQRTSLPSRDPPTAKAPSGLTVTAVTVRAKPSSVRRAAPLSRSRILAVWSSLAETTRRPSGVSARPVMGSVCPTTSAARTAGSGQRRSERMQPVMSIVRACSISRALSSPSSSGIRARSCAGNCSGSAATM